MNTAHSQFVLLQTNWQWRETLTRRMFFSFGIVFVFFLVASQVLKYELWLQSDIFSWLIQKSTIFSIRFQENATFFFNLVPLKTFSMQIIVLVIIFCFLLFILLLILFFHDFSKRLLLSIVLLGALGNFLNRCWNNGKVIDYVRIKISDIFVNFNFEDVLIVVASTILLIILLKNLLRQEPLK